MAASLRQLATGQGACPNCGDRVVRIHRRTDASANETFDCPSCGRFAYGSQGPELPLVVPAA